MKKIYFLTFLFLAAFVISCEKVTEEQEQKLERIDEGLFTYKGVAVPDIPEVLEGLDRQIKVRSNIQKSESTFSSNDCCSLTDLSHPVNITGFTSQRARENGMKEITWNVKASYTEADTMGTVFGSLHSLGENYMFTMFISMVVFGDMEPGVPHWVKPGESNISTAQWEIMVKVPSFAFFYAFYPVRPLHIIEATAVNHSVYVLESRAHTLNGVPFKGTSASIQAIPVFQIQRNDLGEVGDLLEIYNRI